jgi:hypothetical protein
MNPFRLICTLLLLFSFTQGVMAQSPDTVYKPNIATVRLHLSGDQLSLPVYNLNGNDQLELHFDDLEGGVKNYYYTFLLCDYDWKPANISSFDYLRGFSQQRISTYRFSSIALTRYTHYQAILPDRNMIPTRSGNYMLKVFLDGDTSKLVCTKRLLVVASKSIISGQVAQPFAPQLYRTHQKLIYAVNIAGVNSFSPAQQIKIVLLQNNRWDNAQRNIPPSFVRGNILEYNTEGNSTFFGGKEWRWADLRSFRLQSDRVKKADYGKTATQLYMVTDEDLNGQRYVYYNDLNGMFSVETFESINPFWQSDYGTVHFSFAPPGGQAYPGKTLYLTGQLVNYRQDAKSKMQYNPETGLYEGQLFLKQGFYNYGYLLVDSTDATQTKAMEGNYFETENVYTVLVYFRAFTDRADQLIGIGRIASLPTRNGF